MFKGIVRRFEFQVAAGALGRSSQVGAALFYWERLKEVISERDLTLNAVPEYIGARDIFPAGRLGAFAVACAKGLDPGYSYFRKAVNGDPVTRNVLETELPRCRELLAGAPAEGDLS